MRNVAVNTTDDTELYGEGRIVTSAVKSVAFLMGMRDDFNVRS